jgi:histidinol-phosphatase (PHP family)
MKCVISYLSICLSGFPITKRRI